MRPARTRPEGMRLGTAGGEHGHRVAVLVIALDRNDRQVHYLRHLAGDSGEDLAGLRNPGYQRGHAAQRRLLAASRWISARAAVRDHRDHEFVNAANVSRRQVRYRSPAVPSIAVLGDGGSAPHARDRTDMRRKGLP
jgi:hypothetical protein